MSQNRVSNESTRYQPPRHVFETRDGTTAIIGYGGASTQDQDRSLQLDALKMAGRTKIPSEHAGSASPQIADRDQPTTGMLSGLKAAADNQIFVTIRPRQDGAVERNRTSTGYAHSALNAARLPVPPRPLKDHRRSSREPELRVANPYMTGKHGCHSKRPVAPQGGSFDLCVATSARRLRRDYASVALRRILLFTEIEILSP